MVFLVHGNTCAFFQKGQRCRATLLGANILFFFFFFLTFGREKKIRERKRWDYLGRETSLRKISALLCVSDFWNRFWRWRGGKDGE
jgi:hypothetical protein